MKISDLIKYYNQEEILDEILRVCQNREVIPRFRQGFFGTRPSVVLYKKDILDLVRRGAVSFHMSEERWTNPMNLEFAKTKKELDELRIGWDLILDIDTKDLSFAKICARLLIDALEHHNIHSYSIKYSGGTGFHIGVPFESFPHSIDGKEIRLLFPEAAQIIAAYLKEMIKEKLSEAMLTTFSIEEISNRSGKNVDSIVNNDIFDPYSVIEIDTIAISSRHLIRMPYSVNEKRGYVSVPIEKKEIDSFDPEQSKMTNVEFRGRFLDGSRSKPNEAKELFIQAIDWSKSNVKEEKTTNISSNSFSTDKVETIDFPPCIKKILEGMEDGRKRALFILINFLKSARYNFDEIESIVMDWNLKNKEPLRNSYIKSQLNWAKKRDNYLPPNCKSSVYYKDVGVCAPDEICKRIKNPLNYSFFHKRRRK